MRTDPARRETGAGMRRHGAAFASAALVLIRHPRKLPAAPMLRKSGD
jgi:hypothetical protein